VLDLSTDTRHVWREVKSELRPLASIEKLYLLHCQVTATVSPIQTVIKPCMSRSAHRPPSQSSLQLDIQLHIVREPRDGNVKICYRRVSPRNQSSRNHIFQSHISKVPLGTTNDENHMKENANEKNPPDQPLRCPRALCTVALPRARPTPLPRWPRERNMGAFLEKSVHNHNTRASSRAKGVNTSAYPAR
jgi:hypothetical protein